MKIRFLLTLVGLAISFALPSFAQQTNTPDPGLREALAAFNKKVDDGLNNGDAAALAALFTEDAVFVTDQGPIFGRQAIEKCIQICSRQFISATIPARSIKIHLIV